MGLLDRFRSAFSPWDGTSGRPPSGNGASSLHLSWPAPTGEWVAAESTIEVLRPPTVNKLYFWAMQVSFSDQGRRGGAGHIGLQWHFDHPDKTAVNWGGYGTSGNELSGSRSLLPSTVGNVNTRDFAWSAGRKYRLRVSLAPEPGPHGTQSWRGEISDVQTGERTHIRDLWAQGRALVDPMVWSEVFAGCDEPSVAVRWSQLTLTDAAGASVTADRASVNYQSINDGGCANTSSVVDGAGWVQTTNTERITPQGTMLVLAAQR